MAEPRFCDQCGRSLVPLRVPHVQRPCDECGRTVHFAEPGEGGKGIKVEKGDKFTIPAGWLTFSLDPRKSTGRFSRAGVSWFVERILLGGIPRKPNGLGPLLDRYEEGADSILNNSDKLHDLDLEDEADVEKAFRLFDEEQRGTPEWFAFTLMALVQKLRPELNTREAQELFLWALRLQAVQSILVFKENLEEHVWAGYGHTHLIYDVASAAARTPADAEAIEALEPAFANLSENVLRTWVDAEVEIGPRLGVSAVDEPVLKALAKTHLSLFDQRRAEQEQGRQHRSRTWTNRIQGASAGAALVVAAVALLKALGVL